MILVSILPHIDSSLILLQHSNLLNHYIPMTQDRLIAAPTPPAQSQNDSYYSIVTHGFPISLAIISEMIILTINISYISSDAAKAGLGLSGVFVHSFGGATIIGFDYGYATFASRAFGAKNYSKFKLYFVQGFFNFAAMLMVLIIISMFSYRISILAGQEQSVARYTEMFIIYILPGYVSFYSANFIRMTLQSQGIVKPNIFVDGISICFHAVIITIASNFIQEEALVIFCTNLTLIFTLVGMIIIEKRASIWKLSLDLFQLENYFEQYKQYAKQCSYIALPIALDIFIFEFMALYVGAFKNIPEIAAHVIITNIMLIMGSIYIGFSLFMGTRVGNLIGQNNPQAVRAIVRKVAALCILIVYAMYFTLVIFQSSIINFYSHDPQVASYISPIIKLYSIYFLVNTLQFVISTYYKALGYGSWVMKVFALCFYGIGLLSMLALGCFLELKILCAWLGNFLGTLSLACVYWIKSKEIDVGKVVLQLNSKVKNKEEIAIPLTEFY